jgi:hypothetical protein
MRDQLLARCPETGVLAPDQNFSVRLDTAHGLLLFADHQTRCVRDRGLLRTRPLFFGKGVLGTNRRPEANLKQRDQKEKALPEWWAFLNLFIPLLYH